MATPYSSPPTRPAPVPSPDTVLQQDTLQSSSPPPTPRTRQPRAGRSYNASRVRPVRRRTFSEESSPVDGPNGGLPGAADEKDPHDLAFSPKHVTRASVVENMVTALDQFSNPASSGTAASHENRPANLDYHSFIPRQRANTVSSDPSSDPESTIDEDPPSPFFQRRQRSNSNPALSFARNLQPILSLCEEEDDLTTRHRVYDSQRAYAPQHQRSGSRRSGNTSTSSSVDLSQRPNVWSSDLAANRRSQSFDFGSDIYRLPASQGEVNVNEGYLMVDQMEAAPMPIVHAGPSRGHSPIRHHQPSPLSPIFDPNSSTGSYIGRSSKPQNGRKTRPGTMGTGDTKGRDEPRDLPDHPENLPPVPPLLPPSAHSPISSSSRNPSFSSRSDLPAPPARDRPGFFRRVFGSKSVGTTVSSPPGSEGTTTWEHPSRPPTEDSVHASSLPTWLQRAPSMEQGTTGPAAPPKEPQTLTKKSSAFFRRRKKSVSDHLPAPLPSSFKIAQAEAAQPSPVSSLRQGMDPYLAGPPLPSSHQPPERPRTSRKCFHSAHASLSRPHDTSTTIDDKAQYSSNRSEHPTSNPTIPNSKSSPIFRAPQWPDHDHPNTTVLRDTDSAGHTNTGRKPQSLAGPSDGPYRTSPRSSRRDHDPDGLRPSELPSTPTDGSGGSTTSPGAHNPPSPAATPTRRVPALSPPPSDSKTRRGSSDHLADVAPFTDPATPAVEPSPPPSGSDLGVGKPSPIPSLPGSQDRHDLSDIQSPCINITESPGSAGSEREAEDDHEQALKIFENRDRNLDPGEATAWLGDAGEARQRLRMAYMRLFDWTHVDILSALRGLCARIALKAETQQVDRMLEAFSERWCVCNVNHGFRSSDVVHTICYSILLLNTDLHLAELGNKMTRTQFIRNTVPTIKRIALDSTVDEGGAIARAGTWPRPDAASSQHQSSLPQSPASPLEPPRRRSSVDEAVPVIGSLRLVEKTGREHSSGVGPPPSDAGVLVAAPFVGSDRAWEAQIEQVLKHIYSSIARARLPLFGASAVMAEAPLGVGGLLGLTGNLLRRSPSTLSKAASDHSRGRGGDNRLGTGRWAVKPRSRSQFHQVSNHGSTRTSMDEGSSAWSPSVNSTWSKASGARTLPSMSADSFGSDGTGHDFQKSVGFANALSQAIIREDSAGIFGSDGGEDGFKVAPLLPDETLELSGAPWAKEGSLKHKHQAGGVDKRGKGRNWEDCFAVIEKGWMRLFSFSVNAKSLRIKAKGRAKAGGVFGGGNWMDSAEEVHKCLLHHAIASALPEPGYSRTRPFVWALSLPTGALHLFQAGTREIVQEFVSTANYWSARLSKEPLTGGISNTEYGWSDQVINRALVNRESHGSMAISSAGRASMQSSVRSSVDQRVGGSSRPKRAADKVTISEWLPPQQSMMASQLLEVDQLHALQAYVKNVEEELGRHNELRPAMELAFSPRHANMTKAMVNWENKSQYLLKEIVKFKTYLDSLLLAQHQKELMMKTKSDQRQKTS